MSDLMIIGARVMSPNADPHQPCVADVLIRDGKILKIGQNLAEEELISYAEAVDVSEMIATPVFINAHYHSHDTLANVVMEETPPETGRLLALLP